MKTVTISDNTLAAAEKLAAQLGLPPGQLIALAVADFVPRQDASSVTERLNAVYAAHDSSIDPALRRSQRNAIGRDVSGTET